MPEPLATQPVIAFIWSFDHVLIRGDMLTAVLDASGVDAEQFRDEVEGLVDHHAEHDEVVSPHQATLLHLLTYARTGRLGGLGNARLRQLGGTLTPAPGMPDFLAATRHRVTEIPELAREGIAVEHHVLSTGLQAVIEGSALAPSVDGIWASTFVEQTAPPGYRDQFPVRADTEVIADVGRPFDAAAKTRTVFEINKGANIDPTVDVDEPMGAAQRRVPLRAMILVAGGVDDVPAASIVNAAGGVTFGAWSSAPVDTEPVVRRLLELGRVHAAGEADYRSGSVAHEWLMETVEQLGYEIAESRRQAYAAHTSPPERA
jgi:hypothetical protein